MGFKVPSNLSYSMNTEKNLELFAVSHMHILQASCPEHKPHLYLLPQLLSFSLQHTHKCSTLCVLSLSCRMPGYMQWGQPPGQGSIVSRSREAVSASWPTACMCAYHSTKDTKHKDKVQNDFLKQRCWCRRKLKEKNTKKNTTNGFWPQGQVKIRSGKQLKEKLSLKCRARTRDSLWLLI